MNNDTWRASVRKMSQTQSRQQNRETLDWAIETRQTAFAHQLVDELMLQDVKRARREQHTRLQSTGALDGALSMLSVNPSDDAEENA